MSLQSIGAILLVLVVVSIVGHLWFHLVDGILERIKRLFTSKKAPPAWHTLKTEEDEPESR